MDSHKRLRSSSESSEASAAPEPEQKAHRPASASLDWTCSLPPSCHLKPTTLSSLSSLELHHRTFHEFVCTAEPPHYEWAVAKGWYEGREHFAGSGEAKALVCGRVFPDDRFLQLHLTECHDELAQVRRDRGEKIFACFQPECRQLFATPKARRLHLVSKHAFPTQYFFGVTIWGVEDVLNKGGGMVRRDWKPREGQPGWRSEVRASSEEDSFGSPPSPAQAKLQELSPEPVDDEQAPAGPSSDVDDLAAALSSTSISLVPRAVRLARKNKMAIGV